jgi:hypothetical protein
MWSHDSVDSVKSALHTRFVMSPTVKVTKVLNTFCLFLYEV